MPIVADVGGRGLPWVERLGFGHLGLHQGQQAAARSVEATGHLVQVLDVTQYPVIVTIGDPFRV